VTSIDFYFNAGDRLEVACRLTSKALQQNKRVLIYAPQPEIAQRIEPGDGIGILAGLCQQRLADAFETMNPDEIERLRGFVESLNRGRPT
jgi:hypothetical protein